MRGPRVGEQEAVRVKEEVLDARCGERAVDPRPVGALRQPHPPRAAAEVLLVAAAADLDLRVDGLGAADYG